MNYLKPVRDDSYGAWYDNLPPVWLYNKVTGAASEAASGTQAAIVQSVDSAADTAAEGIAEGARSIGRAVGTSLAIVILGVGGIWAYKNLKKSKRSRRRR